MSQRAHVPAYVRGLVAGRDNRRCRHCKRTSTSYHTDPDGHTRHLDHLVPVSTGGSDDPSNLALSCRRCNLSKGTGTTPDPHSAQ
jgi:5-methylcytosine-specific restriction endonuclease McrA